MRIIKVIDLTYTPSSMQEEIIEQVIQTATPPSGLRPEIISWQVTTPGWPSTSSVVGYLVLDDGDLESIGDLPTREPAVAGGSRGEGSLYG